MTGKPINAYKACPTCGTAMTHRSTDNPANRQDYVSAAAPSPDAPDESALATFYGPNFGPIAPSPDASVREAAWAVIEYESDHSATGGLGTRIEALGAALALPPRDEAQP